MKKNYTVYTINHGYLALDGGAMFGSVPRPLWERRISPDEKNRIRLATRSLVIRNESKYILVDVGCGEKWSEKERAIYGFEVDNTKEFKRDDVTDIIITHLHFDHAGGLTRLNQDGVLTLSYPNARIWIQRSNYDLALAPNIREKASYLPSHIEPLQVAELTLVDPDQEIFPDIWVRRSDGHTEGLQYVELVTDGEMFLYPADLIPTSHHLPLPYHMGYDMCAKTLLAEKEAFLERAMKMNAVVVFEHDADVPAARITKTPGGHYEVKEVVAFP